MLGPSGTILRRVALFILVAVLFIAHWVIADPGFEESATQTQWPFVIFFSAALLALALALPVYSKVVVQGPALRSATVAGVGAGLSSVANVIEDGFGVDAAFFGFVAGAAILIVALACFAAITLYRGITPRRRLAVVPVGTVAGQVLYVFAGGPIMFATWMLAAAFTLLMWKREGPPTPG